jgi:hypothetical protein
MAEYKPAPSIPDLYQICKGVIFSESQAEDIPTIKSGTESGIVRWACRLSHYHLVQSYGYNSPSPGAELFLKAFFLTFLDVFESPRVVVEILSGHGDTRDAAQEVQSFIFMWMMHTFGELSAGTRRHLLPHILKINSDAARGARPDNFFKNIVQKKLAEELAVAEKCLNSYLSDINSASLFGEEQFNETLSAMTEMCKGLDPATDKIGMFKQPVPMSIFNCAEYEVANQLTLFDQTMFSDIPFTEYLYKCWERPRYCSVNDNCRRWINSFNAGSEWFASEIITSSSVKERIRRIVFTAELGKILLERNNFMSATMVTFALNHVALKKYMKDLWTIVPQPTLEIIETLKFSFSHEKNYANYREAISEVNPDDPCIPNLLVHHKDLFYDYETIPKTVKVGSKSLVNCKRIRSIGRHLIFLSRCKKQKYNYQVNTEVALMIQNGLVQHTVHTEAHKRKSQNYLYSQAQAHAKYEDFE